MQEVRVSLRCEEMNRIANEREEHRLMLKASLRSIDLGRNKDKRWGIGIFTSWKELLTMSERVSSRVGESIIPGARK